MSSAVAKGVRRSMSRQAASKSTSKSRRSVNPKAPQPKVRPKQSPATKVRAKKATRIVVAGKTKSANKQTGKANRPAAPKVKTVKKAIVRKPAPRAKTVVVAPPKVKQTKAPQRAVRAPKPP